MSWKSGVDAADAGGKPIEFQLGYRRMVLKKKSEINNISVNVLIYRKIHNHYIEISFLSRIHCLYFEKFFA